MINRDPEGYRKLLAYKKAAELQVFTNQFAANFPKTKTLLDLADQMSRSGRSGAKNIVEGWKRNTTKEYFDFLGFSIGAVEELKEDAADITTGVYPALIGLTLRQGSGQAGRMGVMGERGAMGVPSTPFNPSTPSTYFVPSTPSVPLTPSTPFNQSVPSTPFIPQTPSNPLSPLIPLVPFQPISRVELDKLKFYPLDLNLPSIIQLFLRAKEVNYLLFKLQQSLDVKMGNEHTKPASQRFKNYFDEQKQADREMEKYFKSLGLRRLENGQYVKMNKEENGENG